jgi:uncharacterized protein involved in exopolysaccharide biosynthesis
MKTSSVNLSRLAALLWSRRWTLATFVVVAVLLSAYYALTRPIKYESEALLAQVKDDNSQLSGALGSLAGSLGGLVGGLGLPGGGTSVEESSAVLRSRDFSLQFMAAHGVLPYLFPKDWDRVAQRWKPGVTSGGPSWATSLAQTLSSEPIVVPPAVVGPSADEAVRRFDTMRSVDIDRRTNFLKLSVEGPTPKIAQAWATDLIRELNESLRQRALEDSRRAIKSLEDKLNDDTQQTTRVIASALLESQMRHLVSAESRREFALRVLDPPSLPDQRSAPRRARIVMIGAVLGLLLGSVWVVLQSAWRARRRRAAVAVPGRGD